MVLSLTANDAMTQRYKTVQANEPLTKAVALFDGETDVLFVYDEETYKGSLTHRAIIRSGLKGTAKVKRLVTHAPKVAPKERLVECVRLMIENDAFQLPVFRDEKLLGVVSAESILAAVAPKLFGETKAETMMTRDILVCSPQDTLYSVAIIFRNHHISRLPVVSEGVLVGVVSMHDLVQKAIAMDNETDIFATMDEKRPLFTLPVEAVMSSTVETVTKDDPIRQVITTMREEGIGGVIVVDEARLPIGMITKRDILEHILNARDSATAPVRVQVSSRAGAAERAAVKERLVSFVTRHRAELGTGHLFAYLRSIARRKHSLLQCRIRLYTSTLNIQLVGEGATVQQAVTQCLARLKLRLRKEKSVQRGKDWGRLALAA
ncbi:CBS domain-containing protein [Candidatus Woesearchaeota archaeon]|nr:MAG: CBS domain-containing protein [Candidatus Woesearchaeota archaeon]